MSGPPSYPRGFRKHLEPGQFVRLADHPEWGIGQVQSVDGERVTVGFEHAGKVLVNARVARLEIAE